MIRMLLQESTAVPAYLKAGFLGFSKSGKTWTAMLLAEGTRRLFGLDGQIAFFDTEGGSDYVKDHIEHETGRSLLRKKSRVFDDLITVGEECLQQGVSVLIVDSVTHVWRELMAAYLARLNESLRKKNRPTRTRFTLQDIMKIKDLWAVWPDFYLNSELHIIICGRAGFEWDMVENEDGNKELTKTGVKMKVESEFGFEASLLIEMERVQNLNGRDKPRLLHRATVLGDRFGVIDAHTDDNPDFEFFRPHVELLLRGEHHPVKTEVGSNPNVDDQGDTDWSQEKKARTILCEEIQGVLVNRWPGQTAEHKKAKADTVHKIFDTRSWTKVESLNSEQLRNGLQRLKEETGQSQEGDSK